MEEFLFGSSYIHLGQDTIYLQKFHVVGNGELFWHQYMTNVLAPYSESRLIYNGYANTGILSDSMSFIIPVYNNMPETPVENPNILESDFTKDNTKIYADVESVLNVRNGPSTSYEILTSVDRTTIMTRIAKGKQAGELWDKVQLPNGIVGYVFHDYTKVVPEKQIEKIQLSVQNNIMKKGETQKLNVDIFPEEAKNHAVVYSSSNSKIATVDNEGNILAIQSGEVTITVKAKENNVSSQIKIQVYTPVTDMQLNTENLVLQIGDKFILKAMIIPSDASNQKVIYQSGDSQVVQINEAGEIIAIEEGNCKIIAYTEDGNIAREVTITVVPRLQDDEVQFDTSLKISRNEISGWDDKNMNMTQIQKKINTVYMIEVYDFSGKQITEEQSVGTGSRIRLVDENGIIKMEYYIILYGDVNGDGKINSVDLLVLQRHILEIESLKSIFIKAGNINKNGKNPSSLDLLLIQRHILGLKLIEQ